MAKFLDLWNNYSKSNGIESRCFNKNKDQSNPFDNYCAIRLSECFILSGIPIQSFPGRKCWSHSGVKHLLLAEDLAKALANNPPPGFKAKENIKPSNFQSLLSDRTGVIFFKDYWRRGKKSKESFDNRSGDHIDLWNKGATTDGPMWIRSISEFLFSSVSDLNDSKEVWFWEVE